jgi:hypothetical protein
LSEEEGVLKVTGNKIKYAQFAGVGLYGDSPGNDDYIDVASNNIQNTSPYDGIDACSSNNTINGTPDCGEAQREGERRGRSPSSRSCHRSLWNGRYDRRPSLVGAAVWVTVRGSGNRQGPMAIEPFRRQSVV